MLRNLASSLFLTERDAEFDDNAPEVKGRVVTTLHKAKEVRPLVEKCITIACKSLPYAREAESYGTSAERNTDAWKQWRESEAWQQWCEARAPVVAAHRRALQLLGNREAVQVLFDEIAPRFEERNGGYTRILRLAKPRLGDAGTRAILELVGKHDRVRTASARPAFDDDEQSPAAAESPVDQTPADESQASASPAEASDSASAEGESEEQKS